MHRIIRGVVVGRVTVGVGAGGRGSREVITASANGMALRALHGGGVQTGQRETGVIVIERGVGPVDRVVAGVAGLWESCRDVIRDIAAQGRGAVPVGGVARIASGAVQAVVVADVALITVGSRARWGHLVIAG